MMLRSALAILLALEIGAAAPAAEPPPDPQPGERRAFNITPEILEKIREWTGAAPGEQPDLSKLTPEQMAELMAMVAGKEIENAGAVSFGGAGAGAQGPPVGEPAPDLTIDEIIAGAEGGTTLDWSALEGKVVVLEFWATWCAPCIAALPHLNDLAAQFEDREVVFISVTNEDRQTVEAFLPDHDFPGLVVSDTDRSMAEAYGVTAIPRTFIVGADGVLLGTSHPQMVKPEHLDAALRGEVLELAGMPKPQVDGKPVTIRRGEDGKTSVEIESEKK